MVNQVVINMALGVPISTQETSQIGQALIDPGRFVGINIEVDEVLEFMCKHTLI